MFQIWFGSWYGDWFGESELNPNSMSAALYGSGSLSAVASATSTVRLKTGRGRTARELLFAEEEVWVAIGILS